MAAAEFVEIASFANAAEAEQVRGILEENGLTAFVSGAEATTALSHLSIGLGGVRLLVRAEHAAPAAELLESFDRPPADAAPWFCGQCREEVDGAFEVCWSCGQPRTEVEQPFPERCVASAPDSDTPVETTALESPDDYGQADFNPYASPQVTAARDRTEPLPKLHAEAEAMLERAWRAAIIGLVLFPVLTHLYSAALLIRASMLTADFSPAGRRRFYGAMVVNLAAAGVGGVAIRMML